MAIGGSDRPTTYVTRDNGAGFTRTLASRMFGVFQRLHFAHEFECTGIGLATVQRTAPGCRSHLLSTASTLQPGRTAEQQEDARSRLAAGGCAAGVRRWLVDELRTSPRIDARVVVDSRAVRCAGGQHAGDELDAAARHQQRTTGIAEARACLRWRGRHGGALRLEPGQRRCTGVPLKRIRARRLARPEPDEHHGAAEVFDTQRELPGQRRDRRPRGRVVGVDLDDREIEHRLFREPGHARAPQDRRSADLIGVDKANQDGARRHLPLRYAVRRGQYLPPPDVGASAAAHRRRYPCDGIVVIRCATDELRCMRPHTRQRNHDRDVPAHGCLRTP